MRIPVDVDAASRSSARAWEVAQSQAATATRRLATGKRIDSAADDAAGLAISERLRAQYEGLFQAGRNAQEGVNFLRVADGALTHTGDLLQRIRVLAIQSANGTYGDDQRRLLQAVVDRTVEELDAVAHGATYNGSHLLDGSRDRWSLQVGADAGDTFTVTLGEATADALGLDGTLDPRAAAALGFARAAQDLGPLSIATQEHARNAVVIVDRALAYLLSERADQGAALDRLEFMIRTLGVTAQNTQEAAARITDADVPAETARLLRAQIASHAAEAMMVQAQRARSLVLDLLRSVPTASETSTASAAPAASAGQGASGSGSAAGWNGAAAAVGVSAAAAVGVSAGASAGAAGRAASTSPIPLPTVSTAPITTPASVPVVTPISAPAATPSAQPVPAASSPTTLIPASAVAATTPTTPTTPVPAATAAPVAAERGSASPAWAGASRT